MSDNLAKIKRRKMPALDGKTGSLPPIALSVKTGRKSRIKSASKKTLTNVQSAKSLKIDDKHNNSGLAINSKKQSTPDHSK